MVSLGGFHHFIYRLRVEDNAVWGLPAAARPILAPPISSTLVPGAVCATPPVMLLHTHAHLQIEVAHKYSTVDTLRQQYVFIPAKYKDCYLAYVINELSGSTFMVRVAVSRRGGQEQSGSSPHYCMLHQTWLPPAHSSPLSNLHLTPRPPLPF